jgi:hypothetical protein
LIIACDDQRSTFKLANLLTINEKRMLSIFGCAGLGLVWGWLVVRRVRGARWPLVVRMLLWIAVQALLVLWLATPQALIWFAIGVLAGALVCHAWVRALVARYGV